MITVGLTCHKENIETIDYSIESLLELDFLEIIIHVDNNPLLFDSLMHKYKHIKIIQSNENIGLGSSRNKIINQVNTKWIMFLDAGDKYLTYELRNHIEFLKVSNFDLVNFNVNGAVQNTFLTLSKCRYIENLLKFKHRHMSQGTIFNKEFLVKNSVFYLNKNVFHEDLYFALLAISKSTSHYVINRPIYHWKPTPRGLSKNVSYKKFNDLHDLFCERIKIYQKLDKGLQTLNLKQIYLYHIKFMYSFVRKSKSLRYLLKFFNISIKLFIFLKNKRNRKF